MPMTGIPFRGLARLLRRIAAPALAALMLLAAGGAAYGVELISAPERQYGWGSIGGMALSPDGAKILLSCGDGRVRLHDAATGQALQTLEEPGLFLSQARFSPSGATALTLCGVSNGEPRSLALWRLADGRRLWRSADHDGVIKALDWSRDGAAALTGAGARYITGSPTVMVPDYNVRVIDAETGCETLILSGHTKSLTAVAFSPDGSRILSASQDGSIRIYDLASSSELKVLANGTGVSNAFFTPDGQGVVSSDGLAAKVWSIAGGAVERTLSTKGPLAFTPDGTGLLFGGAAYTSGGRSGCMMQDFPSGQTRFTLPWSVYSVVAPFSSDSARLLTPGPDLSLTIWDARTGAAKQQTPTGASLHGLPTFTPDGAQILTCRDNAENGVRISRLDAASGRLLGAAEITPASGTSHLSVLAYSPNRARFLAVRGYTSSGADRIALELRDSATGAASWSLSESVEGPEAACFTPDGLSTLTADYDKAYLRDAATGRLIHTLSGHVWRIGTVAASPDGRWGLTGGLDRTARLWDLATGAQLRVFNLEREVVKAAFSPDGRSVLTLIPCDTLGKGWTMKLWDANTGALRWTFQEDSIQNGGAAFSPDGRRILTGGVRLRLWDAATGKELCQFRDRFSCEGDYASSISFSPDGGKVLASYLSGAARLWRLPVPNAAQAWGVYR